MGQVYLERPQALNSHNEMQDSYNGETRLLFCKIQLLWYGPFERILLWYLSVSGCAGSEPFADKSWLTFGELDCLFSVC